MTQPAEIIGQIEQEESQLQTATEKTSGLSADTHHLKIPISSISNPQKQ